MRERDISPYDIVNSNCKYDESGELKTLSYQLKSSWSYFHLNCQGLVAHWDNLYSLIRNMHTETFAFDFTGLSETYRTSSHSLDLPGYHTLISRNREGTHANRGGVGLFIKDSITYTIREDLFVFIPHIFESLFIEVVNKHQRNKLLELFTGRILHQSQI